ncbi:hypothetical protein [Cellulomonas rhizosphaerae]|uniref:Uncharacterized protein n=1 Tax=Cellulomonas rhizosphaerae TaxID=2293719 RepID=A0A413RP41_9CELL|nr:hypothetical protein [Cellulomonas rhizosphaerae]RHA43671.1 hypothetical protein D1825_05150 [Cellulomonas rhizosphaerae]
MKLDPASREYATWPLAAIPDGGGLEVTFDEGATWHGLTVIDDEARILIAGPDATGNPGETVVLPRGFHYPRIRATISPELLVRAAGEINVA